MFVWELEKVARSMPSIIRRTSRITESSVKRIVLMGTSESSSQSTVASNSIRGAMLKHPLSSYFSMAYATKFIVLIPYTLAAWVIISGDWTAAFVLATFGPFVAGIIMVYLTEGRASLD
jgi:hypothetical protein